jgi:acetyl-CoA acetyltransferase
LSPSIIGWGHTPFGKKADDTVESLVVAAASQASAHSGLSARQIDAIVLGHFNAGFSKQNFTSALVPQPSCSSACANPRAHQKKAGGAVEDLTCCTEKSPASVTYERRRLL